MDNKETAKRLKALIASNKHAEAIEEMLKIVESNGGEGEDGLFVLLGRKNRLDEQIAKHTISKDNADLEFNRITETLLTYADKIGKGEKTTFAVSSPSKEVIEHDKRVFISSEEVLWFDALNRITSEMISSNSTTLDDEEYLGEFQDFLVQPKNQFIIESISDKSISLSNDIGNLYKFIGNHFDHKSHFMPGSRIHLEPDLRNGLENRKEFEKAEKTLTDLIQAVHISYKDFRKEVKHKLFI